LLVIERAGYDFTDAFLQIDPIEFPRASE